MMGFILESAARGLLVHESQAPTPDQVERDQAIAARAVRSNPTPDWFPTGGRAW
jgi:hypothetical protein